MKRSKWRPLGWFLRRRILAVLILLGILVPAIVYQVFASGGLLGRPYRHLLKPPWLTRCSNRFLARTLETSPISSSVTAEGRRRSGSSIVCDSSSTSNCDWSCPDPYSTDLYYEVTDPYSTDLYYEVKRNCSAYRFITIPPDFGRLGHTMSQVYILLVFHEILESFKASSNRIDN